MPADQTTISASSSSACDQVDVDVGVRRRDHAVLRGRQEAEEGAVLTGRDRSTALRLASERVTGRVLDLHHVGAAVGQQLGAVRTREAAREVDHPGTDQRPGIAHPGDRNRRTGARGRPPPIGCGLPPVPAPRRVVGSRACRSSAGGERGVDLGPGGAAGEVAGLVAARPPGRRDGRGGGRGVGRRSPHRQRGPELRGRRARPDCGACSSTTPRSARSNDERSRASPGVTKAYPFMVGVATEVFQPPKLGAVSASLFPVAPGVDLRADRATGGGAPPRSGARRRDRRRRERPRPLPPRPRRDDGDRAVEPRPGPAAVRARRPAPSRSGRSCAWSASPSRCRATPAGSLPAASTPSTAPTCPRSSTSSSTCAAARRRSPPSTRDVGRIARAPGERRGYQRPLRHPQGEERHRPRARRADPVRGGRPRRWWRAGGPGAGADGVGRARPTCRRGAPSAPTAAWPCARSCSRASSPWSWGR